MPSHYTDRLHAAIRDKATPALVGLDPRFDQLPTSIREKATESTSCLGECVAKAFEEFCLRVIDVVAPLVPAVKPQVAFFEECGPAGMQALWNVIRYARQQGLLVIADAKRGDIGSTALGYARAWLAGEDIDAAPWGADALTINPYLGIDTLQPFVDLAAQRGAGLYVLVRTSNPGSGDFQNRETRGETLYERVARAVEDLTTPTRGTGGYGAVGAVVGATYPAELAKLRDLMPSTPLLVPGYGSQGGTSADVAAAFDAHGLGGLVNSSRGIIFAGERKEFRERFTPDQWEAAIEAATRDDRRPRVSHPGRTTVRLTIRSGLRHRGGV
ncbi:MAG: orotidine-5'-phosphate decarboxylase [Planctomycetaceae bacterium]